MPLGLKYGHLFWRVLPWGDAWWWRPRTASRCLPLCPSSREQLGETPRETKRNYCSGMGEHRSRTVRVMGRRRPRVRGAREKSELEKRKSKWTGGLEVVGAASGEKNQSTDKAPIRLIESTEAIVRIIGTSKALPKLVLLLLLCFAVTRPAPHSLSAVRALHTNRRARAHASRLSPVESQRPQSLPDARA